MKQEMKSIMTIDIFNLKEHPDNPRKDLGDLSELTESIKKNGIMQNLTVIPKECLELPVEEQPDIKKAAIKKYVVLIGHRRLAAAKAAGLDSVPCKIISGISKSEQIAIMLEENMQRNDLTVYEQAQSFQLMLDLGETVDTISEKVGFSKTTIYHRINIAKLNQKELKKKEEDDNFQLSIKDLYALEKVKKISKRNEILKNARDSKNLQYLANQEATKEQREENAKKILKELKDRELEEIPDNTYYYSDYEEIKSFDLDKEIKKVSLKKVDEKIYYKSRWGRLTFYLKKKKESTAKQELTEEEKRKRKNKKILNKLQKDLETEIKDFIKLIYFKKVVWPEDVTRPMWRYSLLKSVDISLNKLRETVYEIAYDEYKSTWNMTEEEKADVDTSISGIPIGIQMILFATKEGIPELTSWDNDYRKANGESLTQLINVLKEFGFSISKEKEEFINGSHEAFEGERE